MVFRSSSGICHYARVNPDTYDAPGRVTAAMAWNTLSLMTTGPGRTARGLFVAADEALVEAAFCTGAFATAERLFGEARAVAARDDDQEAEARAVGGLGMTHHYRNIATLVGGQAPANRTAATR